MDIMVVVDRNGDVVFDGLRDECLNYMRQHSAEVSRGDLDLAYATRSEHGIITVGRLSTFILPPMTPAQQRRQRVWPCAA